MSFPRHPKYKDSGVEWLGEVPAHLRDSHYAGAKRIGHGNDYVYPHDDPRGWVPQEHLPAELRAKRFYVPSDHGAEADVARRLDEHRGPGADG